MRPNSLRAKNAITALYFVLGATVIMLFLEFLTLFLLSDTIVKTATLLNFYRVVNILGTVIYLGASIGCAITFIQWFRRAYFNLHQLIPSSNLRYTEGWAAGAWFIPIFWWFGPYQIAKDLFSNSEKLLVNNDLMDRNPLLNKIAAWWWALWIIPNILNGITGRMKTSYEFATLGGIIDVLGSFMSIGAALFAVKMIRTYMPMVERLKHVDRIDQNSSMITNDDLLDSGI